MAAGAFGSGAGIDVALPPSAGMVQICPSRLKISVLPSLLQFGASNRPRSLQDHQRAPEVVFNPDRLQSAEGKRSGRSGRHRERSQLDM